MKSCSTCHNSHQTPSLELHCTLFGCVCTEQTATDCTDYMRATGADDESPWFKDGWCVTTASEGRGD